ncbi:MAG: response regulator [Candidatus Thermoplasmatota archaeon]|nr:response regulator [Candidatus Thermoplasmatota archaeon]
MVRVPMAGIMIVDDERELLSLFSEMIRTFGHDIVATETNGERALKTYGDLKKRPDLVILDHRMPVRNGLETAMEMLNMDPDQKIIFISADASVKRAALDLGVVDFLEKPFLLKALRDSIQKALVR